MAVGLVDCWRVAVVGAGKKADEQAHCMRGQGDCRPVPEQIQGGCMRVE